LQRKPVQKAVSKPVQRASTKASPVVREGELTVVVRRVMRQYFKDLDGEKTCGIYDMVVLSVEKPLLEVVMLQAQGNQTRAAELLGLNRNTLRKKLQQHGLE
jgi:Fis family transcriptional regulator